MAQPPLNIDIDKQSWLGLSRSQTNVLMWLAAMMVAFPFDGIVSRMVQPIAMMVKKSEFAEEIKEPGHFVFVLVLAAFVWILHPMRWRGSLLLIISAIIAGLLYTLVKWPVGRMRPITGINPYYFQPFRNGFAGLFHAENASFPSGHACLGFATASCMSYLLPKGRIAFYVVASLLAAERVLEMAHYLTDVIAAAGLGIIAFNIALKLIFSMEHAMQTKRAKLYATVS